MVIIVIHHSRYLLGDKNSIYGISAVMTVFAAVLTFLLALEPLGKPIKAWHWAIEDNF